MKVDFSALKPRFMTIATDYDKQITCQQCGENLEDNCVYDCDECVVLCHPCGNGEVPLDALLKEINRLTAENERLSEELDTAVDDIDAQYVENNRLNMVIDQAWDCVIMTRSTQRVDTFDKWLSLRPELAYELTLRSKS